MAGRAAAERPESHGITGFCEIVAISTAAATPDGGVLDAPPWARFSTNRSMSLAPTSAPRMKTPACSNTDSTQPGSVSPG
jgi:hypothetical protein